MTTFKRYEMIPVTRCGEGWQELQEEPEGDWMRYEDCEALTRQNAALRKALEAVRDDEGLADVIAGVGEGIPPFMHKVLDALAMEKL